MTFDVALLVFGVLLLLVGLVGKVKAKELEVGTNSRVARSVIGLIGAAMLALSFNPDLVKEWYSAPGPPSEEPVPPPDPAEPAEEPVPPRQPPPTAVKPEAHRPALEALFLVPGEILGGQPVGIEVVLDAPALEHLEVRLETSGRHLVEIPEFVEIPPGHASGLFPVPTREIDHPAEIRVEARLDDSRRQARLSLDPMPPEFPFADLVLMDPADRPRDHATAGESLHAEVHLRWEAPEPRTIWIQTMQFGADEVVRHPGFIEVPAGHRATELTIEIADELPGGPIHALIDVELDGFHYLRWLFLESP